MTLNLAATIIYQIVYAISGLVLPKMMLNTFGSNINGLVTSLSSYLSFFALMESGLGSIMSASLYKPLFDKDTSKINSILKTGFKFYKKIAILNLLYAVLLGFIYPYITNVSYDTYYILLLTIIMSLSSFFNYYFSVPYKYLLYADKKNYILMFSQIVVAILNIIFTYVSIKIYPQIHFIKFINLIVYLINPLIAFIYAKENYRFDFNVDEDKELLKQRWDGFSHNLTIYITNNVDYVLLSLFSTLSNISIYSIYSAIINSIKNVSMSISETVSPYLGSSFAKETNTNQNKVFDNNLMLISIISILLFSCTLFLIDDFMRIYTANINDANYNQSLFGYLLIGSAIVDSLKEPYMQVTVILGDFKRTKYFGYVECTVNIILSTLLIRDYGLCGIAAGTLISKIARLFLQLLYLKINNHINSIFIELRKVLLSIAMILALVLLDNIVLSTFVVDSYITWILKAFLTLCANAIIIYVVTKMYRNKKEESYEQ